MKVADIMSKSDKELELAITEARQKLAQSRVDMRSKQTKNVKEIKALRKNLAQVLTIQTSRQLNAATAAVTPPKEDNNG